MTMDAIQRFLDDIFRAYPATPEVARAKADLLAGLADRYEALRAAGHSDAEAVGLVIQGFGSVSDLADELHLSSGPSPSATPLASGPTWANPPRPAATWANPPEPEAIRSDPPRPQAMSLAATRRTRRPAVPSGPAPVRPRSIAAIYWPLLTAGYLLVSFLTGMWAWTWIIWVVGALGYVALITAARPSPRRIRGLVAAVYWPVLTALYLGTSFLTHRWDVTWVMWVVGAVAFPAFLSGLFRRGQAPRGDWR
jgi:hypothetical protein